MTAADLSPRSASSNSETGLLSIVGILDQLCSKDLDVLWDPNTLTWGQEGVRVDCLGVVRAGVRSRVPSRCPAGGFRSEVLFVHLPIKICILDLPEK